ncbi:hypothetical protein CTA1_13246 [Colletotrichum tanaceti]|uniref:Uncharacterized protein n=1 Tax=Colletotrichum tanaceti TaxID=1306861 RepID=A0A4U6XDE7_9PEZI|nr:hypothetical protein CTA1_13246 [Colletotrichum tanaceti]
MLRVPTTKILRHGRPSTRFAPWPNGGGDGDAKSTRRSDGRSTVDRSEAGDANRLVAAIVINVCVREAEHADSLTKTDAVTTTTTTRALELRVRPPPHHVRHLIDNKHNINITTTRCVSATTTTTTTTLGNFPSGGATQLRADRSDAVTDAVLHPAAAAAATTAGHTGKQLATANADADAFTRRRHRLAKPGRDLGRRRQRRQADARAAHRPGLHSGPRSVAVESLSSPSSGIKSEMPARPRGGTNSTLLSRDLGTNKIGFGKLLRN